MVKRVSTILLAIMLTINLSGCMLVDLITGPSETADKLLTDIQNGQIEGNNNISSLLSEFLDTFDFFSDDDQAIRAISAMGKSLEYEINSVNTRNSTSYVGVTVKNKDMLKAFEAAVYEKVDWYFDISGLSEDEFLDRIEDLINLNDVLNQDVLAEIFIDGVTNNDAEIVTKDCEFMFVKQDDGWVLENNTTNKKSMLYTFGLITDDNETLLEDMQEYIVAKATGMESDINEYVASHPDIDSDRLMEILYGADNVGDGTGSNSTDYDYDGYESDSEYDYDTQVVVTVGDCFLVNQLTDLNGNVINPYDGYNFVVVEVSGTNYGEYIDAFYVTSTYFVGTDNEKYYAASATWDINSAESLINDILSPGETTVGYLVYEVPQDVRSGLLYLGEFSENVFTLSF